MTRRAKVDAAWDAATAEYVAACKADPLIAEAIGRARAAPTGPERNLHVAFAASRIAPRAPRLSEDAWRSLIRDSLAGGPLRTSYIPGIAGRIVWVIRDEAAAAALRDAVGPGQVWVRTDLVRADDLATVWAHAMDAKELDLGIVRAPGRPDGSRTAEREAIMTDLAPTIDGMTDDEVDAYVVERGLWEHREAWDADVVRRRVARLRADVADRGAGPDK